MMEIDSNLFSDRILMCSPDYYGIRYSINPWMNKQNDSDPWLAEKQWQRLHHTIIRLGGFVELCDGADQTVPDLVFTANAALIHNNKALISAFRYPERQAEQLLYGVCLEKLGFDVIHFRSRTERLNFEGAGDALFAGETLFAGYGFRTDKESYYYIQDWMFIKDLVYCELVDPYFYHLDTCFCPLNDHQAIYFPDAFSQKTQESMQNRLEMYPISEEDAKKFACNAVVLGDKVIIPSDCPMARSVLENLNFEVHDVPMTEFIKSGGACKCLTLKL